MPLKPPFDATDLQSWPQNGEPLRITVHPYTPPQASTGDPTAADGVDDWFVPPNTGNSASYPNDWFVPAVSSGANNIQSTPNFQYAPVATANGNTIASPSNNPPAARPDPLAAYWSLIPASRAGAMAWHPPIFLPPNPFAPENIPASAWVTPPPIFLHSLGQFPSPAPKPLDVPPTLPAYGLLGAIARLPDASTAPSVPAFDGSQGLLGAIARLPDASAPARVPSIDTAQGLFAPMFGAQPVPKFGSVPFYGPPFETTSGFGDPYPLPSLLRNQAAIVPAPSSQPAGVNEFPIFNANGTIPPSLGATPLATTAAAAFARGGGSPAGPVRAGTDSNPFSRLLNALNPISPANAAEDEGGGLPPALFQALLQGAIDGATEKRLIEQRKILQEAEDARRELFEVAQGRASSKALGIALEASGVRRGMPLITSPPAPISEQKLQGPSFRNSTSVSMMYQTESFCRRTRQRK